jgi:deoxyribose-phosphate aldolase
MTKRQLASFIDHTFLKPTGDADAVERLCEEARGLLEQAERAAERVRAAGGPGENAG